MILFMVRFNLSPKTININEIKSKLEIFDLCLVFVS